MNERFVSQRKFRIIYAETKGVVRSLPFELPNGIKMLLRNGDWKPWNEEQNFGSRSEALERSRFIGILAPTENKNAHVFDIEEILE